MRFGASRAPYHGLTKGNVMCSRFTITSHPEAIRDYFHYRNKEEFPPRYNIAPSQPVPIVRASESGARELTLVRWGLIPSWVKDPGEFSMIVNARSETVREKPSFRNAIKHRRCLVPADGFYEWQGARGQKRPYFIKPQGGGPIAFAGIWEDWMGADGSEMRSMAILTTESDEVVGKVHNRMPVVVDEENFDDWLDCMNVRADEALQIVAKGSRVSFEIEEIDRRVNNPRNDDPEVQKPVQGQLFSD